MRGRIDVWAPPGLQFGPWQRLPFTGGGPFLLVVNSRSDSAAPGSYDGELAYFDCDDSPRRASINPNAEVHIGSAWQQPKVRFRASFPGQSVIVSYAYSALPEGECRDKQNIGSILSSPLAATRESDVRRVIRSDAYWTPGHPDRARSQTFAADWYRMTYD